MNTAISGGNWHDAGVGRATAVQLPGRCAGSR